MEPELKTAIDDLGTAFQDFKREHNDRVLEIEKRLGRPNLGGGNSAPTDLPTATMRDVKTGRPVPVFDHKHRLAALEQKTGGAEVSVGRVMRGLILGGRADDARQLEEERKALGISPDPAGGYTVGGALAYEWIDLLRAQSVLSRAGVRTVPMDSKTLTLARVASDPVVTWHGENAPLPESEPTFGAVALSAKTATCLVKMSLELSQDSANIEDILTSTMVAATATAVDSAGLVGVTVNAGAAPDGIFNLAGRNTVTSIGAPTSWDFLADGLYELLLDNVPATEIGAFIAHPVLWRTMTKLKTGITNDKTPLPAPEELARVPKLWTTAAPFTGGNTVKGVLGRWQDLLFGVRKDISVVPLQQTFMGSNLQVALLVYVRCDFAATRPASFCTLEGITV